MRIIPLAILSVIFITGCKAPADAEAPRSHELAVAPGAQSAPTEHGALVNVGFWRAEGGPEDDLILGAAEIGGVEFYRPDGRRAGGVRDIVAGLLAVIPDVGVDGEKAPLVLVYDVSRSAIEGYRLERDALDLRSAMPEPIPVDDEVVGMCHHRSRLSGSDYLYAVTDGGLIHHYELYAEGDGIRGRLLRSVPSGKGSAFCAVDARDAALYVSEESTGIWRLGAEPESDTTREPLDVREPFGTLSDDLKGLAIYPVDAELSYLVVSDAGAGALALYRLPDGERLGTIAVEGLGEAEGLAAASQPLGGAWDEGLLAIADEEAGGVTRLKIVAWQDIAGAAKLATGRAEVLPPGPPVVRPVLETDVVPSHGDAADDPAIWVNRDDPAASLVIGTDKQRGLLVFGLDGRTRQLLPDGKLNNVDVRYGFPLGGSEVDIAAASNRSTGGIAVYRVDAGAGRLVAVADGVLPTGFVDPYGACLYRSTASGEFYVFVNEGDTGLFRQWRLFDNGAGRVAVEQVREFPVGSQAEGCVADDETGLLYIAEEDGGLWKYSAEPDGGGERTLIDGTGDAGRLTADVEGVALWPGEDGRGYIVASNQGADNYAVYRREGDNAYVGHFHIVANPAAGVDGASETDGLDVTSMPLGERFPSGLLVVQDGRNIAPREPQNFKFVSWADVEAALGLQ